jgi:membrane protein
MGTLAQPRLGRPFGRRIVSLGRALRRKALRDDVATQASALTFTAFLSIFPLLLLATSLVGFRLEGRGMASIDELVSTIPGLTQLVAGQAQTIVDGRFTAGIVGVAGLVWAASALSNRARRALGVIFGHQEAVIASRFDAVVDTFVLGAILIVGGTVAGLVANVAHDRTGGWPGLVAADVGVFSMLIGFFLIAYRLLAPGRQTFRDLLPGAVVCAMGWTILQGLGSWFVARQVAHWSALYGTIATVFGVLLFLRIAAWIFLAGAELSAILLARSAPQPE